MKYIIIIIYLAVAIKYIQFNKKPPNASKQRKSKVNNS